MISKLKYFILGFFLLSGSMAGFAQGCANCKQAIESDLQNGGSIATGLNTGILYLMTIPYIIIITGAYFFFKKPIDAKIKAWWQKRFPSKQNF